MAKKRKRRKKQEPETERYEIEVNEWEADYHFGLNPRSKDFIEGVYWEYISLILEGNLISPVMEKTSRAKIEIAGDPQLEDHWKPEPTIKSARAIGRIEIPRGDDTLNFFCSIPSRSLPFIALALQAGKTKFVSIFGTKLKWQKGTISSITLSKELEE